MTLIAPLRAHSLADVLVPTVIPAQRTPLHSSRQTIPVRASPPFPPPAAPPVSPPAALLAPAEPASVDATAQGLTDTLPVTTVAHAVRVAMDRTRRMTLLGEVPVVGLLVVPWLFPLHLLIVGLTADHIRLTPDASLSYSDGVRPRPHLPAIALAVAAGAVWLLLAAVTSEQLLVHDLVGYAVVIGAVLLVPPVVELLGLVEFALLNPEWLTLRRQRERRADGRTTYVLTSLVTRVDGHDHARRLMDLTYPQWQAADALVIGYPASKRLISYYVRMGARRERNCRFSGPPARRRVMFDCRQPLRDRHGHRTHALASSV